MVEMKFPLLNVGVLVACSKAAAKEAKFSYSNISLCPLPSPTPMFSEPPVLSKAHLVRKMVPPLYSVLKERTNLPAQTKTSCAEHHLMVLLWVVPTPEEQSGFRSDLTPRAVGYLHPVSLLSSLSALHSFLTCPHELLRELSHLGFHSRQKPPKNYTWQHSKPQYLNPFMEDFFFLLI